MIDNLLLGQPFFADAEAAAAARSDGATAGWRAALRHGPQAAAASCAGCLCRRVARCRRSGVHGGRPICNPHAVFSGRWQHLALWSRCDRLCASPGHGIDPQALVRLSLLSRHPVATHRLQWRAAPATGPLCGVRGWTTCTSRPIGFHVSSRRQMRLSPARRDTFRTSVARGRCRAAGRKQGRLLSEWRHRQLHHCRADRPR